MISPTARGILRSNNFSSTASGVLKILSFLANAPAGSRDSDKLAIISNRLYRLGVIIVELEIKVEREEMRMTENFKNGQSLFENQIPLSKISL